MRGVESAPPAAEDENIGSGYLTKDDLAIAIELVAQGISAQEVADYFDCNTLALCLAIDDVLKFRNVHDRVNNVTLILQSKINMTG